MPVSMERRARPQRRLRQQVVRLEPVPAGRMRLVFALLCVGLVGLIGDWLGAEAVVLLLALVSLWASVGALRLPEVSDA